MSLSARLQVRARLQVPARLQVLARLLVPALIAAFVVPATAGPAAADTGPLPLSMTSFARIVVDQAHGHLFLSPGRSGSALTVTDLGGTQVGLIAQIAGATGMALTPDGSSLWVAAAAGDALVRVDTTSLSVVQTVPLPAGTCPGDVAVSGSRVVYGYSCNTYGGSGGYGGLGVVDAASGAVLGTVTTGPFYRPVLAAGAGGQVYAGDVGLSPANLYLYSVTGPSGSPFQLIGSRANIGDNLRDLAASPDGTQVVVASGYPYAHYVYSNNKLESAGVYASGTYPNAAAWSGNGQVVAVGTDSAYDPDVRIYVPGAVTPQRAVDFGSYVYLQPRGLAISVDGTQTWAVTGDTYGANLAVRTLSLVAQPSSSLTLSADPPAAYPGAMTSLGGRLTSAGLPLPGVTLTVSRTVNGANGGSTTQLAAVTTRADGTYSFADTLPTASGTVTYRTSYAGDAAHAPASGTAYVTVWPTAAMLSIKLTQPTTGSPSVTGLVILGYSGTDTPGGVTVHVSRTASGATVALPDVVTSPNGAASFTDTAPPGTVTYLVSVDATAVHPAATASAYVGVVVATLPTAMSMTASMDHGFVGLPVTLSGSLSSASAPLGGRSVTVRRTGCGGSNLFTVGTVTTGLDGVYSISDTPPEGTCFYQASFVGDNTYAATSATLTLTVVRRITALSISQVRGTGAAKKTVTVTAHLGTTHVSRVVTITATPSGGLPVTIASGTVNATGDLVGTYQPRTTTTTYTATFAGDDWYLPATALITGQ